MKIEVNTLVSILSLIIAAASFIFGLLQHKKSQELEKEKIEWEKEKEEIKGYQRYNNILTEEKKLERNKDDYRRHIAQNYEYMDLLGDKNNPWVPPLQLEKMYVIPRIEEFLPWLETQSQKHLNFLLKKRNQKINGYVDEIFKLLLEKSKEMNEPLKLILLGQTGSGKTTLLKWIAYRCVVSREKILSEFIPAFISFKDLALDPQNTYRRYNLKNLVAAKLESFGLKVGFFERALEDNHVLFLFDGLDEVLDKSLRQEIIDWLQNQIIGNNALIISCGNICNQYQDKLRFDHRFQIYSFRDFDISDIRQFLENFYRNIEYKLFEGTELRNTAKIRLDALNWSRNLESILTHNQVLYKLAVKPGILTIIAIVYLKQSQLSSKLPELIQDCFTLMIQRLNTAFFPEGPSSSEQLMEYLSSFAVFMMENDRKTIGYTEIKDHLPGFLEEKQLETFVKDVLLNTGLLYESNNKYGFLHDTFQEFLAAWHFARVGNHDNFLEYRGKENWPEILKLFINIADNDTIKQFFNEIILHLEDETYWKQLNLWEDCLLDITDSELHDYLELQFARRVLEILRNTEFKEKDETFIIYLYAHYPLFKHASSLSGEAWELFHNAKHPFVQTIGSSILYDAGRETPDEVNRLINTLKSRINEFEKLENKTPHQLSDFLLRNNNCIPVILTGRNNLGDLIYALAKLKTTDSFIKYLVILNLENLRFTLETVEILKHPVLKEVLELLDTRQLLKLIDFPVFIDIGTVRDLLALPDFLELRREINIRAFLDYHYFNQFQAIVDHYLDKYRYQLTVDENLEKINNWVDTAVEKLNALTDEKLLYYFPETSPDELESFRNNSVPRVARTRTEQCPIPTHSLSL